ncbi:hypothetical protein [Shimia biformata]|uniref:hypothetical protein n=1 Tax=Shimia biformata TaxID=1294299 RepID=UPI00194F01D6|nr:hypothetical protein [Shimia biformata]
MFFGILLLLGGAAFAGSLAFDGFSEQDSDESNNPEDEEDHDAGNPSPTEIEPSILDVLFPSEPGVQLDADQQIEVGSVVEVTISDEKIENLPGPLSDWVVESDVERVTAGEEDQVSFEFPEGTEGSLIIVPANYIEVQDDAIGDAENTHTGFNLYFAAEGDEWPEGYKWSEQGASLYNTTDMPDREEDFGSIRLISRIETGSFGTEMDANGEVQFIYDFRLGIPEIESNIDIVRV